MDHVTKMKKTARLFRQGLQKKLPFPHPRLNQASPCVYGLGYKINIVFMFTRFHLTTKFFFAADVLRITLLNNTHVRKCVCSMTKKRPTSVLKANHLWQYIYAIRIVNIDTNSPCKRQQSCFLCHHQRSVVEISYQ